MNELLETLVAHYDDLPEAVQRALGLLDEGETLSWGVDFIMQQGVSLDDVRVEVDGCVMKQVVALLPALRAVELVGGNRLAAKRAAIVRISTGEVIRSW